MARTFLKQWGTYYVRSGTSTPYGYDTSGRIRVYLVSQSIAGNYSDIEIDHYGLGCATDAPYYGSVSNITSSYRANNGSYGGTYKSTTKSYYGITSTATEEFYIGTTSHRINHNVNGTATLYFNGSYTATITEHYDYGSATGTKTASSTTTLPKIPRATTITSFNWYKDANATGLSKLWIYWAAANNCDDMQYSLNGGSWTSTSQSGTSGYYGIGSLTPNTQYSMKIRVKRADTQIWTESSTLNATTYDIAKITSAPNNNVNMDNTQTITYTNPSGASLETSVYRTNASTVIAGYRACSGTSYTFTFTAGEKTAFYNEIPSTDTLPLRFYLLTSDGLGNTYLNYAERTFEVFNANPTFTTWTYADTNATTIALTGSNQKIIKGYSNVKATITSANKMVANKGATATSYQLAIGTKITTAAYSGSSTVEMTLNAVDNSVFDLYAIDSRGNSTKVQKTASTYINYSPIVITGATGTRTDDIGTQTTLAYNGTFFGGSFGSVTNTIKSATYKFKKTTDVSYTNGTSVITPTKTGGTFSFSGTIKGDEGSGGVNGFDATYSYNIQVIVTDELSTHTFNFILGSGKPNIAMHRDGIAINQPYDETLGGALQVNGPAYFNTKLLLDVFYPVGTIYETTSTNFDTTAKMGTYFGGTWEVYGAGRVLVAKSADTEFDTIGETGGAKTQALTVANLPSMGFTTGHFAYSDSLWTGINIPNPLWESGKGTAGTNDEGVRANVNAGVWHKYTWGSNTAHNNLQPYIVVYRYRRTA